MRPSEAHWLAPNVAGSSPPPIAPTCVCIAFRESSRVVPAEYRATARPGRHSWHDPPQFLDGPGVTFGWEAMDDPKLARSRLVSATVEIVAYLGRDPHPCVCNSGVIVPRFCGNVLEHWPQHEPPKST